MRHEKLSCFWGACSRILIQLYKLYFAIGFAPHRSSNVSVCTSMRMFMWVCVCVCVCVCCATWLDWLDTIVRLDSTRQKRLTRLDSTRQKRMTRLDSTRPCSFKTRDSSTTWLESTRDSSNGLLVTALVGQPSIRYEKEYLYRNDGIHLDVHKMNRRIHRFLVKCWVSRFSHSLNV